jgi:hypothetical protein
MNEDYLALKIFNRLNDYLKKHNAYTMFKIENEIIYTYSHIFNRWIEWNSSIDISINEACKWFLLGSPEIQTKINGVIKYKSFFVLHNNTKDQIVKQLCDYIGEPICLEEIILKMDLMGI